MILCCIPARFLTVWVSGNHRCGNRGHPASSPSIGRFPGRHFSAFCRRNRSRGGRGDDGRHPRRGRHPRCGRRRRRRHCRRTVRSPGCPSRRRNRSPWANHRESHP